MPKVPQRYRRTDRRTDGRTTYDSNTALALRASCGKNCSTRLMCQVRFERHMRDVIQLYVTLPGNIIIWGLGDRSRAAICRSR